MKRYNGRKYPHWIVKSWEIKLAVISAKHCNFGNGKCCYKVVIDHRLQWVNKSVIARSV
jgi:hypothetical protein